ncbi:uncharacterized protein [Linepithema humile]|nr:PREDICTED: zinc finger protein 853-like isoform X2 [Linepithema humile]XP_012227497.1 PREDICTED: zinc finger protein 853-like isoform X2 [Linepithema humile]
MIRLAILVLAIDLANSQLNYEGNPFTEYTEYIAEESNLSERSAKENNSPINLSNSGISSHPQKLYPIMESKSDKSFQQVAETDQSQGQASLSVPSFRSDVGRQFQVSSDQDSQTNPAEVALNTFLNSRTPEESRMSLDHYLRSQTSQHQFQPSDAIVSQNEKSIEQFDTQQQMLQQQQQMLQQQQQMLPQQQQMLPQQQQMLPQQQQMLPQQQALTAPQLDQQVQLTSHVNQGGQVVSQLVPQVEQQRQQLMPVAGQTFGYARPPLAAVQPVIRAPAGVIVEQGILHPVPLVSGFQTRNNELITPAMWRERMRRIRGRPFPFAQSRIAPGLYKGPMAVPFKPKAPVEVIYTKPPGFYRGSPIISNPPVAYEDASAWFPDANRPPPNKDVYYSQLYAQSYDPHYYNYIATTGKIRPHLYGKLGRHPEEKEDGIWSELYRGFKKHGLKNIMTPTFLLGMTLPVVTLMLSALVQKRSIARSDGARELDQEDTLREYLERLQRAMECYDGRSIRDAKPDGC